MKIKNEKGYQEWVDAQNGHSYGLACFRYAEKWAELMESEIAQGKEIKYIAERLSHQADTEGITGFMYGVAVTILSNFWEYGAELRVWHNAKYNYDGDGEANPALLQVGKMQ